MDAFFAVLGWVGALARIASLIPGMQWLAPIAILASAASTIYNCVKGGARMVGCIVGIITAAIPGGGQIIAKGLRSKIDDWVGDAITQASRAVGLSGDAMSVARGWG
jgi:hypothetical protein